MFPRSETFMSLVTPVTICGGHEGAAQRGSIAPVSTMAALGLWRGQMVFRHFATGIRV